MRRRGLAAIACARAACLCALAAIAFALATATPAAATEQLADGIAAQVGSDVVLVSDVMRVARPTETQMRAAGAPPAEIAKVRANALEQLIETRLLARVVKQSDLNASDKDVDEAIAGIAKENGLTVEQLQASVTAHDITYKEYRDQIRQEIERRKVVQTMIASRVHITEDDLKEMYAATFANQPAGGETFHIRQILIMSGAEAGRDTAQACALANQALARIRSGTPFEEVAREVSAVAPMDGGDIGWMHVDTMAAWMKEPLAGLEPGGVSDVLELPFGCGMMKLVEKRTWVPVEYDAAKPTLEQQVYEMKLAEEYRSWMNELRKTSYIERRGYFADAAKLGGAPFGSESQAKSGAEGTGTP